MILPRVAGNLIHEVVDLGDKMSVDSHGRLTACAESDAIVIQPIRSVRFTD